MSTSIGQKIKYLRERAKLSQLELEEKLNASPGSISRIETDKTNPTKETLLAIARSLNLTPTETIYILGINDKDPLDSEIKLAKDYFDFWLTSNETLAYLLDQKSRVLAWSIGFKNFASSKGVVLDNLLGLCVCEILFDHGLGIRSLIAPEQFTEIGTSVLAVLHEERKHMLGEPWWRELMKRVLKQPGAKEIWESVQNNSIDLQQVEMRRIVFKLDTQLIPMEFKYLTMPTDNRFNLILYEKANL